MVLLLGQYSVGKTSFIQHMIKRDFPGIRIGPEPTTDRFVAVMHGKDDTVIPGNALAVQNDKPFRALNMFGTTFLNRLECAQCNSKILENMTFIDTPGVLSGEKQRIGRQYDFPGVIRWFAERADRILLLFDAHKLDVSDEFKRVIESLHGHDDKIRVVLNKADTISNQQLMRVYGALMWSLGKIVKTPEVLRVYIGSFWDNPNGKPEHDNERLFQSEYDDLVSDLKSLPRNSAVRKVNELVKRARMAKVHAYILSHLRGEMPSLWGKAKKQEKLLANLEAEFVRISQKHMVPRGDFPRREKIPAFRNRLKEYDLAKFPALNMKMVRNMETILSTDIPQLMSRLQHSNEAMDRAMGTTSAEGSAASNPFADTGLDDGANVAWAVGLSEKRRYDNMFYKAELNLSGKLAGRAAKQTLYSTGCSADVLLRVWTLADIDKDGALDADEFAVAMYLAESASRGVSVPDVLPPNLVPPSKRG